MSVLYQIFSNCSKINTFRKSLNTSFYSCKCLSVRYFSDVPRKFVTFDEVTAQRREEASRSLVVQVNSESSFSELYGYCSKYATVKDIYHYKNEEGEHFMLIEFPTEEDYKEIIRSCTSHSKDQDEVAVQSPFLWFKALPGKKEKLTHSTGRSLVVKDGCAMEDENVLLTDLYNCSTVSNQIQLLHDRTRLNDLSVRLRYIVARQLELLFSSLYSNVSVQLFGSSVNGYGKMGCDLDMVLTTNVKDEMQSGPRRLVYSSAGRPARTLELAAAVLERRAAGVRRVTRVLLARVPIVKCEHVRAGLRCDLSHACSTGVHMSTLLWQSASLDSRAAPLATLARRWARAAGLTAAAPGRWLTGFPLTLLVLFYLQRVKVLPPWRELFSRAGKEDIRLAEDNVNCTFLRDLNKLPSHLYGQSDASLETLLFGFFEYYAQFDFQNKAVSVIEGEPIRKPNAQPLYIVNPLEQALNVSRNVSYEECERFRLEVRNAAWQLESALEGTKAEDWGILSLIEQKSTRGLKKLLRVGNSHRLVSVKDLFNDDEENKTEGISNKIQRLSNKSDSEVEESVREMKDGMKKKVLSAHDAKDKSVKYKNNQVANEVCRIRRDKMV